MTEIEKWNNRVVGFLNSRLAREPSYRAYVIALWREFLAEGLADLNFVNDITSGNNGQFFQRVWEMMLARHLKAQGHDLCYLGAGHPDFRFEHQGKIIWVEAIAPEPQGLPSDWLTPLVPGPIRVGNVPHNETLLRWTAAFQAKWRKLSEYRNNGVVGPEDA
jgi:hypothetical protein